MTERGTSFLRPMDKRTCKSLNIPVTRCSCATFANEDPNKSIFRIIAIELAHILKRSTEKFPTCLPVKLHRAKEVRIISEGPSDNEGSQACEINIEVRAKGNSATYTEDFVFSLIKSPEEWYQHISFTFKVFTKNVSGSSRQRHQLCRSESAPTLIRPTVASEEAKASCLANRNNYGWCLNG